ncbi:MAG: T9SS type A sorting domain-containing protein, partial [Salinivirgaceae bacterium]|nr:T9SS type A sorting domain-containing protein [Salinivirgaceae bacterium]
EGDEFIFGTQTLIEAGEYNETFASVTGCDSIVTLTLTVNSVDNSVLQDGAVLTANTIDAAYQWATCDVELTEIEGETNQTFTATTNGDYAVIITENSCIDTSICYTITGIGILENSFNDAFYLYPNPTNGNLTIDTKVAYSKIQVRAFNVSGQQVYIHEFENKQLLKVNLNDLTKGIYTIKLNTESQIAVYRIIKE